MRADWVDKNPKAAKALLMAVMEAQQWCDKLENKRRDVATIVGKRQWFNVPVADIIGRVKGDINYGNGRGRERHRACHEVLAGPRVLPVQEPRPWFLTEDIRWGKFEPTTDIKALVDKVNREDIWREAAKDARRRRPPTSRPRPRAARRPSSTARSSIPPNPTAYLKSLSIKRVEV